MGRLVKIGSNLADRFGVLNLMRSFVFNNQSIELYDTNITYNKNDKVYIVNSDGDVEIYSALEDNIYGTFDESKWRMCSLSDFTGGADLTNLISISKTKPNENDTKIWLSPLNIGNYILPGETPSPMKTHLNIIFSDGIKLVEDPTDGSMSIDVGDLVFDSEGEHTFTSLDDFNSENNVSIDEQEDVHIGDNISTDDNRTLIWIDTDISDDF